MHEFFFENLRNPARSRRAGLMRQFRSSQLDSSGCESSFRLRIRGQGASVIIKKAMECFFGPCHWLKLEKAFATLLQKFLVKVSS
jgi:hypothetical protein